MSDLIGNEMKGYLLEQLKIASLGIDVVSYSIDKKAFGNIVLLVSDCNNLYRFISDRGSIHLDIASKFHNSNYYHLRIVLFALNIIDLSEVLGWDWGAHDEITGDLIMLHEHRELINDAMSQTVFLLLPWKN